MTTVLCRSTRANLERRTGIFLGRALDGWMLARAQLHQLYAFAATDFGITFLFIHSVALRNLGLLIKTDWSVSVRFVYEIQVDRGYSR